MGGALARAAAKSLGGEQIAVCDKHAEKVNALRAELGVCVTTAEDIAKNAKFVVLAVKPQAMQETLTAFAPLLYREDITIVTMAAGLSIQTLRRFIGRDLPIIRMMPNTPVAVGKGMVLYACDKVSPLQEQAFLTAFAKAGAFDKIPEEQIDAAGALSGCGPAFAYAFAQALSSGAVSCGVPQDKAEIYTAQTLLGAAEMLLAHGNPEKLKNAVCSPNGTTVKGIRALERLGFHGAAAEAVIAAYKRSLELNK